jgi:hypothetical protein
MKIPGIVGVQALEDVPGDPPSGLSGDGGGIDGLGFGPHEEGEVGTGLVAAAPGEDQRDNQAQGKGHDVTHAGRVA